MSLHLSKALLYALHALHYINEKGLGRPVMVREICEKYSFSYDTVLAVMRKLTRDNILTAHRGIKGGFTLRYSLKKLSILNLMEALDGPIVTNDPLDLKTGHSRLRKSVVSEASKINEDYRKKLDKISCTKFFPK